MGSRLLQCGGRISPPNPQVCDRLHGGPTAKRYAAFLHPEMTQLAHRFGYCGAAICPELRPKQTRNRRLHLVAYDPLSELAIDDTAYVARWSSRRGIGVQQTPGSLAAPRGFNAAVHASTLLPITGVIGIYDQHTDRHCLVRRIAAVQRYVRNRGTSGSRLRTLEMT